MWPSQYVPAPCKWWFEQPVRASSLSVLCQWCRSSCSIRLSSVNFIGLSIPWIWLIFSHGVKRPGLDLWPLNGVTSHTSRGLPSCQFLAYYALPIFDVGSDMGQTDGKTDRQRQSMHYALILLGRWHNKACSCLSVGCDFHSNIHWLRERFSDC